jgi:hypothetical protein
MDTKMSIPNHVKVVVVVFVLFIIFQFYFQSSMRAEVRPAIETSSVPKPASQLAQETPAAPIQSTKPSNPAPKKDVTANLRQPTAEVVEKKMVLEKGNRCGGPSHSTRTRPCSSNDTICGSWTAERYFRPTSCEYQDITSEQARKCLGDRSLGFIGDSQMRDLAVGVALFLLGKRIETSSKFKVDHKLNNHMDANGTRMPDLTSFKNDSLPPGVFNYLFPTRSVSKTKGYNWQVQYYALSRKKSMRDPLNDILNNQLTKQWPVLKPLHLAFFSHGLQDYGWWNKEPYGEKFYSSMVADWAESLSKNKVPSVWVSLNSQCAELVKNKAGGKGKLPPMIDAVNSYVNAKAKKDKIPYWDAAAPLRTPSRCDLLDDGVHVKMFVDIMRAKMLFNHLCDKDMNWRGGPDSFL